MIQVTLSFADSSQAVKLLTYYDHLIDNSASAELAGQPIEGGRQPAPVDIHQWRHDFHYNLARLDLPIRVFNALIYASDISTTDYKRNEEGYPERDERGYYIYTTVEPHIRYSHAFEENGRLLGFEEWVQAIYDGRLNLYEKGIRNFADKSWQVVQEAVEKYLKYRPQFVDNPRTLG